MVFQDKIMLDRGPDVPGYDLAERISNMFLAPSCPLMSAPTALLFATAAFAADPSQQKPGDWTVKDFRFHTGEVLPELKLHYVTIGEPTGKTVLVLHGSNGSGQTMLGP